MPSAFEFPASLTIGLPGNVLPPFSALAKNAKRSEESGAEAIWFPDHLMGFWPQAAWTPDITPLARFQPNPHTYLDPFVALSAACMSTSRIKLGTSVTQPLGRHPAHLAQTFMSLSHLSGGRVILGIGAGEAENLTPYGMNYEKPAAKVAEAIEIIRMLWEHDDPVTFEGDFWQLRDATLGLTPSPEAPAPPIWVAGHGPVMLKVTGRHADGWLPFGVPSPEDYAVRLGVIQATARAAGRHLTRFVPGLWTYTVVHEDPGEVERILDLPFVKGVALMMGADVFRKHGREHPLGPDFNGWRDYIPSRLDRDQTLDAIARVPLDVARECVLAGTPDQITARLRGLEAVGLRHVVLWNVTFFADLSLVKPSFDLLSNLPFSIHR